MTPRKKRATLSEEMQHRARRVAQPPAPVTILPDHLDLTAAARVLIERWEQSAGDPYATTGYVAMERLWWALTGTDDTDSALNLARDLAARTTHAYIPPL